ncbi:MAG: SIS domain-containing protein [Patescibacteria group bacterium]|nr:SIS domain-containing protein [Patescibacteria group bacterium]
MTENEIDFDEITPEQVGRSLRTDFFLLSQAISENIRNIPDEIILKLLKIIEEAKDIYVYGAGRSGNAGRSFATRLMHLGYIVYVVGEPTTPAMSQDSCYFIISGSGNTPSIANNAEAMRADVNPVIVTLTMNLEARVAKVADLVIHLQGKEIVNGKKSELNKKLEDNEPIDWEIRQLLEKFDVFAPLNTVFEDTAIIFLDTVIDTLAKFKGTTEDEMRRRHTKTE